MTELTAINPATGDVIATYPLHQAAEIDARIDAAHRAFKDWRRRSMEDRARLIAGLAPVLEANKERYARLIVEEMGKPIKEAIGEVEKCAWLCTYYAEHGPGYLADEIVPTDARRSLVAFEPLGIVLAVMPWNFPIWQVLRFAVPALLAGNTALLKHAPNVPGAAVAVEDLFREAGFPEGVFQSLMMLADGVAGVIEHPHVRAVTLTGSVRAGRAVAAKAGECLKKSVMELGGSDPFVVLADADLDKAAEAGAQGRLFNTGQACIAAKRFIVVDQIADRFFDKFSDRMAARVCGDPMRESTDLGPLARADLKENLARQVEKSIEMGATSHSLGTVPNGPGEFYPTGILTDVRKGMPAFDEELFGPVAGIIRVKDEAEAIAVANDTNFGLGAVVFTEDLERAERIAKHDLEAGVCFVNDFVKSDPRLPFGGSKDSGYGRELSIFGIREFVNIKTVSIA